MNEDNFKIILPTKIKIGKRNYAINTQSMYQGMHFHVRRKIMRLLKEDIIKQLVNNYDINFEKKLKLPLNIKYKFFLNKKKIDIDNISYIYIKAIHDSLSYINYIKDDNSEYINKYSVELIKDNSIQDDKVIIKIKVI